MKETGTTLVYGSSNLEVVHPFNFPEDIHHYSEKVEGRIDLQQKGENVRLEIEAKNAPFQIDPIEMPVSQLRFGGGGLNMALGLHQLEPDEEIYFVSPFGEGLGQLIRQYCENAKITTIPLSRKEPAVGVDLVGEGSNHLILGYRPDYAGDLDLADLPPNVDRLMFGGIIDLDMLLFIELQNRYPQTRIYAAPRPIVFKVCPIEVFALQLSDWELGSSDYRTLEAKVQNLQSMAEVILITRSHNGGLVWYDGQLHPYQAFELPEPVKDPTGAGDATLTAFAFEYERTGDLQRSVKFASVASSLVCRQLGGPTMPSRDEVENYLVRP